MFVNAPVSLTRSLRSTETEGDKYLIVSKSRAGLGVRVSAIRQRGGLICFLRALIKLQLLLKKHNLIFVCKNMANSQLLHDR